MKKIIAVAMTVTVIFMSGCKSPSTLANSSGERNVIITARFTPTIIDEVMKACSCLNVLDVEKTSTGLLNEAGYENTFFSSSQVAGSSLIRLKVTSNTTNNKCLDRTMKALTLVPGVLQITIQ